LSVAEQSEKGDMAKFFSVVPRQFQVGGFRIKAGVEYDGAPCYLLVNSRLKVVVMIQEDAVYVQVPRGCRRQGPFGAQIRPTS